MIYAWRMHYDDHKLGMEHLWEQHEGTPRAACGHARKRNAWSDTERLMGCMKCQRLAREGSLDVQERLL